MPAIYLRLLILLFYLFTPWDHLAGQDPVAVDSLQQILSGKDHDTIKADASLALAGEYLQFDPKKSIAFCLQARELAIKGGSNVKLITALGWLAYVHEQIGELPQAMAFNEEALGIARKTGNRKKQSILLNNLAAMHKDLGDLDLALELNLQSLEISEELKDTNNVGSTYNNLGLIYQGQGKIEVALDHYTKALRLFERQKNHEGMSTSLQNLGAIYKEQRDFDAALLYTRRSLEICRSHEDSYGAGYALNSLGSIFEEKNQLDSALLYYQQALELRMAIDDQQGEAYTLKNIGNIYDRRQQYDEAEAAYRKSLDLFTMLGDKWGETKVTHLYGSLLLKKGKISTAENYLKRSLRLGRELGYPADISAAAFALQQLYRQQGAWNDALEMYDEYLLMHDSIQNDNNRKAAIKTQFRYEYEKKEAQLRSEQDKQNALAAARIKNQKRLRNIFLSGFAVVLVFATIFLLQRNRISKEKKRSEALLLNILPQEIAEELKAKGEAEARQFDSVTVLFTDFKDFTIRSMHMTPRELVDELNMCFKAFDEIVTRYRLEKIKTVGDAYLAVAGLPVPNPDHALNAVHAAMEIRDFMEKRWQEHTERTFQIRCGIHSGTVVAGIVGVKKYAYDIWGDTVNTAARMEQNSEAGKINISGTTYELVKDHVRCVFRGKIEAKNKGSMDMYYVENT